MCRLPWAILLASLFVVNGIPSTTAAVTAAAITNAAPAGLIDINRASAEELRTLPGIRDAYANAIVRRRPYKNKGQILSRKVIPRAAYLKIKDLIIAKQ